MAKQLQQIQKMGGLGGIAGMLPGIGKLQKQIAGAKIDDKMVRRQLAIITSMTLAERRNPDVVKASVKQVSKLGQKGLLRHGLAALRPGGGGGFKP